MQVHDWPVGPLGLLYDRGWMVVNGNGVCLNQKREPRLCLIRPQVHLPSNKLLLQASGQTVCWWLTENDTLLNQKKNSIIWIFTCVFSLFEFLFFLHRPVGMDTISVPLDDNSQMHRSYRVCQSKVCGDRWAGNFQTSERSSWRK